jgi:hypothetical protein
VTRSGELEATVDTSTLISSVVDVFEANAR